MVDLWLEAQQKKQQHFHRINGFLSLQLKLRLELGFRLRLTNIFKPDDHPKGAARGGLNLICFTRIFIYII